MWKGKAFKLGDNISTDHIIPGRFFQLRSNLEELAKHTLEDIAPSFRSELQPCGFLVTGKNFGLGSSREHAPLVLKMSGVKAVLAESVARIFFRNAINQGLPVLICDTSKIDSGDELEVDFSRSVVTDLTNGQKLPIGKMPQVLLDILEEGGLVPYMKKYGDFRIEESA